jgi:hypothetical protein
MNKIEKIHFEVVKDNLTVTNMIMKSAEITTDIAVKFAEWIADTKLHGYSKQLYEAMIIYKVKTTEELFQEFINNHYGKNNESM